MNGETLLGCVAARWKPGIGDPDATGWLTVLAYLGCCLLAVLVWRALQGRPGRGFWGLLAVLLLALAINKQLDLQTALTATGKCMARAQGWYDNRRVVQALFITALLSAVLIGLLAGLRALRGTLRQNGVALIGLAILAGFVLTRAVSFHHIDRLIGLHHFGISANYVFENAGLLLIALNAWAILRRGPRRAALPG